jgi:hypothetical protein
VAFLDAALVATDGDVVVPINVGLQGAQDAWDKHHIVPVVDVDTGAIPVLHQGGVI